MDSEAALLESLGKITSLIDKKLLEISELQQARSTIEAKLRSMESRRPSFRDAQICLAALNDRKQTEIAEQFGLTKSAVSKIIKKFMPFIQKQMMNGVGGTVERFNSYNEDWEEIDNEIDKKFPS